MRRVGVLIGVAEDDPEMQSWLTAFRGSLEKLGWSEGRNIRLELRLLPATSADQYQAPARELLALQPNVILVQGTPNTAAMQRESRTVPIVFIAVSDPVGSGLVASLARPGGNTTGFLQYEVGITGKWMAMLKEIAPHLTRVAIIGNPQTTPYDYFLQGAGAVAPALAIEPVVTHIVTAADIEGAIESFARVPNGGLLVLPDTTPFIHREQIIMLAARHRLPSVYPLRLFVAAGGLMSYGVDRTDQYRQAATYVDRILRGEKPADLPVQAPVKYETVINLKTAKALRLTVPPSLLAGADEVIE
jgi:putative ABC transport system substrate-binding protein